jgi:hypothetical protein
VTELRKQTGVSGRFPSLVGVSPAVWLARIASVSQTATVASETSVGLAVDHFSEVILKSTAQSLPGGHKITRSQDVASHGA